ncbi:hypothetical protein O181_017050 [Austropuccinia psidii MF-1]|uniref:Uncharacterized protein n=1 Tax=Austropuccinia psidii MF-1 TaxID=1389203 RepID=A0A9Q3C625_9BASI|nr:hypothetical protein [Austropuccinia psidii MF-1]
MSPVQLRNLVIPRNQPEDGEGLFRTRRPGRGHLEHSGGWQDTEENPTHSAINFPIQQKPQTRIESHKAVQTPGEEGNQDKGESSNYTSYRRTAEPDRAYSDSFRITWSRPTQLYSGFTPSRHQQISDQESPFFTIPGSFQENTRIQVKKQDFFQPKAEGVRNNDPEAVGLGERSTQEPEIVVNTSRISSPNNRNATPIQNKHSVVTPESNLNSDLL